MSPRTDCTAPRPSPKASPTQATPARGWSLGSGPSLDNQCSLQASVPHPYTHFTFLSSSVSDRGGNANHPQQVALKWYWKGRATAVPTFYGPVPEDRQAGRGPSPDQVSVTSTHHLEACLPPTSQHKACPASFYNSQNNPRAPPGPPPHPSLPSASLLLPHSSPTSQIYSPPDQVSPCTLTVTSSKPSPVLPLLPIPPFLLQHLQTSAFHAPWGPQSQERGQRWGGRRRGRPSSHRKTTRSGRSPGQGGQRPWDRVCFWLVT